MEGMFLAFLSLHLPGKASEKRNVGKCFLACIFVFSLCLFTHTHTHTAIFFLPQLACLASKCLFCSALLNSRLTCQSPVGTFIF